jgi:S-adenosylmethionine:tRNA ribosyltransferase-isomerase
MLVSDFDFDLPDALIAQEASPRGESRLLVLDRATGALTDAAIGDLPRFLKAGDLLAVNDSRVFAARLLGNRVPSGGAVECLLLSRVDPPSSDSEERPGEWWTALMHPGQKLKPGALVRFSGDAGTLMAQVVARHFQGRRTIRVWTDGDRPVADLVDALGHVPLPPYIARPDRPADRERYQTVYARERGSVAAPTAGLHFTEALLDHLRAQGVERVPVTLHVGYGTFKPVKVDRVEDHIVDPEPYSIGDAAAAQIARARAEGRRIIAVGTTTTRALEDAARRGGGIVRAGSAHAETFIYPGFEFQIVSGLVTNFHLPRSSLLMLVSAFAGRERVLAAYRAAIARGYRFYSYGDAMLIL